MAMIRDHDVTCYNALLLSYHGRAWWTTQVVALSCVMHPSFLLLSNVLLECEIARRNSPCLAGCVDNFGSCWIYLPLAKTDSTAKM